MNQHPINKPFVLDKAIIKKIAEKAIASRVLYGPGWGAPFELLKKKKPTEEL